jgi:hypothetical protein
MRIDYNLGHRILLSMAWLDWRMVETSLLRLNDDQAVLNPKNLVQVAIRQKLVVFIDQNLWSQLDDSNKVALLIHEALYAMAAPRAGMQNAPDTRAMTGLLFTRPFVDFGFKTSFTNSSFEFGGQAYEQTLFKKGSQIRLAHVRVDPSGGGSGTDQSNSPRNNHLFARAVSLKNTEGRMTLGWHTQLAVACDVYFKFPKLRGPIRDIFVYDYKAEEPAVQEYKLASGEYQSYLTFVSDGQYNWSFTESFPRFVLPATYKNSADCEFKLTQALNQYIEILTKYYEFRK